MFQCTQPPRKFAAFEWPLMTRPNLLHPDWFNDPAMEGLPLTPKNFHTEDELEEIA